MRNVWILGGTLLTLALAAPSFAQQLAGQPDARSFFTGADPRQIKTVKIDTSKAMRGPNFAKTMQPNATQRSSKVPGLGTYFPRLTLGTWPPKTPTFSKVKTPVQPKTTVPKGAVNLFNPK